jgi:hypothetical protein
MSFAATSMLATTSIVVSPGATVIACNGPQAVGVMLPLKVPLSAPADPTAANRHTATSPHREASLKSMGALLRFASSTGNSAGLINRKIPSQTRAFD